MCQVQTLTHTLTDEDDSTVKNIKYFFIQNSDLVTIVNIKDQPKNIGSYIMALENYYLNIKSSNKLL